MNKARKISGLLIIFGVIGFILIVVYLQAIQKGYDPLEQQMSELALGKQGSLLILAFACLALSIFNVKIGLQPYQLPTFLNSIIIVASICMLGAGIFRIGVATNLHIALVSIAFILIVLVMYFLPNEGGEFGSSVNKVFSWSAGIGTAASIALGQNIVPLGIGQRAAALCMSVWLLWIGMRLVLKGN